MSVHTTRTRTAVLLAAATFTGLVIGGGGASAAPVQGTDGATVAAADDPSGSGDALPDVSADGSGWPAELSENTRLFVNPYRSYLVQTVNGRQTLVLSTGFDSCYFMTQDGVGRYPC